MNDTIEPQTCVGNSQASSNPIPLTLELLERLKDFIEPNSPLRIVSSQSGDHLYIGLYKEGFCWTTGQGGVSITQLNRVPLSDLSSYTIQDDKLECTKVELMVSEAGRIFAKGIPGVRDPENSTMLIALATFTLPIRYDGKSLVNLAPKLAKS